MTFSPAIVALASGTVDGMARNGVIVDGQGATRILGAALLVVALAGFAFVAVTSLPPGPSQTEWSFPGRLSDTTLVSSANGDAAMAIVKQLHRDNPAVKIDAAWTAQYAGAAGRGATFWVSESATSADAAALVVAMNGRVGQSGMFTEPSPLSMAGLAVSHLTDREATSHHYFYAKERLVIWIQIDGPDEAYRLSFLNEALREVG